MSPRGDRAQRFVGRPRATRLPLRQKVVVRTSGGVTVLIGLLLLVYSIDGMIIIARYGYDPEFFGLFTLAAMVIAAVLGVGLLVGGIDQLFLRDDHKLSAVALGVVLVPLFGGLAATPLRMLGVGNALLVCAGALCVAATWILHRAHRASPAAPADPPPPEPVG